MLRIDMQNTQIPKMYDQINVILIDAKHVCICYRLDIVRHVSTLLQSFLSISTAEFR